MQETSVGALGVYDGTQGRVRPVQQCVQATKYADGVGGERQSVGPAHARGVHLHRRDEIKCKLHRVRYGCDTCVMCDSEHWRRFVGKDDTYNNNNKKLYVMTHTQPCSLVGTLMRRTTAQKDETPRMAPSCRYLGHSEGAAGPMHAAHLDMRKWPALLPQQVVACCSRGAGESLLRGGCVCWEGGLCGSRVAAYVCVLLQQCCFSKNFIQIYYEMILFPHSSSSFNQRRCHASCTTDTGPHTCSART